jgi:hypothetical protein
MEPRMALPIALLFIAISCLANPKTSEATIHYADYEKEKERNEEIKERRIGAESQVTGKVSLSSCSVRQ